jgi:hypothetical protein
MTAVLGETNSGRLPAGFNVDGFCRRIREEGFISRMRGKIEKELSHNPERQRFSPATLLGTLQRSTTLGTSQSATDVRTDPQPLLAASS